MEFLKLSELSLNSANYLIGKSGKPVNHLAFVEQQAKAHYVVSLAAATKGKVFKCGKLDDLDAIKAEVKAAIGNIALNFAKFEDEKGKVEQINLFMQEFNAISDVESVGDYFSEGVVKVAKLYTIDEILKAVKANIEILS